jgi:hypothetical protein
MDPTPRMIANLTGEIVSKIRVPFGVVYGSTPKQVLELSVAVGSRILDHMSRVHDMRAIADQDGHLLIPRTE